VIGYGGLDSHINSSLTRALNFRLKNPPKVFTVDYKNFGSESDQNEYYAQFLSKFMWPHWEKIANPPRGIKVPFMELNSKFLTCWVRKNTLMSSFFNGTEEFCRSWGMKIVEIAKDIQSKGS
jgi:hypothetical protein